MPKTQQEIVSQGYQALVNALGVVDAIRFIQHFTPGQGDYTRDRYQWLAQTSPEELFASLRQRQANHDTSQYEEVIE